MLHSEPRKIQGFLLLSNGTQRGLYNQLLEYWCYVHQQCSHFYIRTSMLRDEFPHLLQHSLQWIKPSLNKMIPKVRSHQQWCTSVLFSCFTESTLSHQHHVLYKNGLSWPPTSSDVNLFWPSLRSCIPEKSLNNPETKNFHSFKNLTPFYSN